MSLRKYFANDRIFISVLCVWTVTHLVLCGYRSFWMDEQQRLLQMHLPIVDALITLYKEPSPFLPGEIIAGKLLMYLSNKTTLIFGLSNSPDRATTLWWYQLIMRLPSIIWGAYFLVLSLINLRALQREMKINLSKELEVLLLLPLLFSVSLTTWSTQFRPYAPLLANSAFAFAIVFGAVSQSKRKFYIGICLNTLFGHLYGAAFIAGALLYKKHIRALGAVVLFITINLLAFYRFNHELIWAAAQFPSHIDTFKQILATLSNPHRASLFFMPLAVAGYFLLPQSRSNSDSYPHRLLLLLFLVATVLGPIFLTIIGKYFFMPRQIIGGTVVVHYLIWTTSLLILHKQRSIAIKYIYFSIYILCSISPWTMCFLRGLPPFVDQPIHRYRELARDLINKAENGEKQIILHADPGGMTPFYLNYLLGSNPAVSSRDFRNSLTSKSVTIDARNLDMNPLASATCWTIKLQYDLCFLDVSSRSREEIITYINTYPNITGVIHARNDLLTNIPSEIENKFSVSWHQFLD